MTSAHIDTFARNHLPPAGQWPELIFDLPELQFPPQLNCATELLDRHIAEGRGDRVCLRAPGGRQWTYAQVQQQVDRIARVLVTEMGLVPGNRVLLHAPNNPMLAMCWFAVMKAGGIAVTTVPALRPRELSHIINKAQITHALCDFALINEVTAAADLSPTLVQVCYFNTEGADSLEARAARQPAAFETVATADDDVCLIAFTSGTTGIPKATMHFHRDVMAICACWPGHVLHPEPDDVFIGSPPLAFTFGLGGLLLFPMTVGASTVLLEKPGPDQLLDAITEFGATVLITAPTSYRRLVEHGARLSATPLRKCVSAGEALPAPTRAAWRAATGIEIIDGIGATEMLHIFISADEQHARPGATGIPVPGYRACVVDPQGRPVAAGTPGLLAVQGPTGCRYLDDPRQTDYVRDGWNITGDTYVRDADGYFSPLGRADDMIISAGYNIAAPEVENAMLAHDAVVECAVVGLPDVERGQIVKAFAVLAPGTAPDAAMRKELQDFVKRTIAPYKYPRAIEFVERLPRTNTGKLQRFKLREAEQEGSVR